MHPVSWQQTLILNLACLPESCCPQSSSPSFASSEHCCVPQPASIPYGTLFLHSFNDSLALSRSAGWISMSRDLQILCRVMTRQPSLICSKLPQASTCQCLAPASQPYCHHSEESGRRPQAETQPKTLHLPSCSTQPAVLGCAVCPMLPPPYHSPLPNPGPLISSCCSSRHR